MHGISAFTLAVTNVVQNLLIGHPQERIRKRWKKSRKAEGRKGVGEEGRDTWRGTIGGCNATHVWLDCKGSWLHSRWRDGTPIVTDPTEQGAS